MNKTSKVLHLIKSICGNVPMKCHDVNYALVKKNSGLDTKHLSGILNYLKSIGYLEKSADGWKITEVGLQAIDGNYIANVDKNASSLAFANSLKCISEDLHAMLRCGIVPTEKWVSSTASAIDSILKLYA